MSFKPRDYLRHIPVEVEYLLDQSQGLSCARFAAYYYKISLGCRADNCGMKPTQHL